jgi:hypothetical protein
VWQCRTRRGQRKHATQLTTSASSDTAESPGAHSVSCLLVPASLTLRLPGQARLLAYALATLLLLRLLRPRRAARLAPEASTRGGDSPPAGRCVAWRATQCGSQYSTRLPLEDLSCSTVIQPADKRMSGACVKGSRASALRASLVPDSNVSQTPQATASAGNSGFTWRRWRCCVARA